MRPIISAAVHLLVQEPDLHVTFLTQVSMLENLRREVAMHGHDLGDRLTFIAVLSQKESQVYDKGQDKIVEISTAPVVYVCYRALVSATDD